MFNFSENFRLPRFHLPLGRTRPKVLERDGGGNTGKYILQKYKRAVWLNDAGHHSVAADAQKRLLPKAPNHTTSPPPPRYVCEYVRCTVVDHTHHRLTQTAGLLASAVAHKPPSEPAYHYHTLDRAQPRAYVPQPKVSVSRRLAVPPAGISSRGPGRT
jgi:hypothetical protein